MESSILWMIHEKSEKHMRRYGIASHYICFLLFLSIHAKAANTKIATMSGSVALFRSQLYYFFF
jgi:hypothetical protein